MSRAAMQRKQSARMWVVGLAIALLAFEGSLAWAQQEASDAQRKTTGKSELPLASVVLFNSGVGFYEHRAEIDGNAEIEMRFRVEEINDLLKSMVLQDLGGGRISTVTYASKDPITKTLKTFSIDLTENPTLANILAQVRGERIEIEAPNRIQGTIVGLERRQRRVGKEDEVIEVDVLNLLTDDGLRSIPLEQVGTIKLLDERLNQEFSQALALLAAAHATDKKTVTLNFHGEGKRPVRVGYVQQAPIWKTSYRLVLKDSDSPLLQGWAIVENTTEQDWNDVRLTLVSGRPISFVMNLYDPLYVNRPLVEPELYASLRPQNYERDLAQRDEQLGRQMAQEKTAEMRRRAGRMGGLGGGVPVPAAAPAESGLALSVGLAGADSAAFGFEPGQGVEAAAQAGDVGELFQYVINEPVTLSRQRSAMLPIVNGPIDAKKVSIYNENVQAKHPLNGLKLKNTTDLHLMQGPITVFDGGAYAGDAQLGDLPAGGERLLSYALDLDVEVARQSKSQPEQLTSARFSKGVFEVKRKLQRSVEYTVRNSGSQAKQLLIEYPRDANWSLIEPKEPAETTRDRYRFELTAEPGKPDKLVVNEEMIVDQRFVVGQMDDGMLQFYISSASVKPAVKAALQEIVKRRQELAVLQSERENLDAQLRTVSEEQTRIRENMSRLDRDTELYQRYVKKFGEQEDQIERDREQIQKLVQQEFQKRQSLDEYVANLDLD